MAQENLPVQKTSKRAILKKLAAEEISNQIVYSGGEVSSQDMTNNIAQLLNDSDATIQDKVEGLRSIQIALLAPILDIFKKGDELDYVTEKKATIAENLNYIIDRIINGVYKQQDYIAAEEIDFLHPKVQKAFEFLIQGVLETLKEIVNEDQLQEFVNRFSTTMIGFEEELDKRMYGVSSKTVDKVQNPLLKRFLDERQKKENATHTFKTVDDLEDDS